jgi:hypothetical protein
MLDAATIARLHALIRRERLSLFHYIREVPVWVQLRDQDALAAFRALAAEQEAVIERLTRWMQKHGAPAPGHEAFPDFTPYNDCGLGFLLPKVIEEQRRQLVELSGDAAHLPDEAAEFVRELARLKQEHIPALEALQPGRHTFTTATV